MTPDRPLVLIGAGRMGGAMLSGWLTAGRDPRKIVVVEPEPSDTQEMMTPGLRVCATPPDLVAETLVLAVKPQLMHDVLPGLRALCDTGTMILSIAAGIKVDTLAEIGEGPVVRAMPNTPAAIGKGITAAYARNADAAQLKLADKLLSAIGLVQWVDDEALIDAATGVSGSGPAYVFYLCECLAQAGVELGLPAKTAAALARQTIIGAGALLERSVVDPAELRRNVTSPGGTTAAALETLWDEDALQRLITRAVSAATERSRELGS